MADYSVTQVLSVIRDSLDRVDDRVLAKAADKGTMVHKLCFKHIMGPPSAVSYYANEEGRQILMYLESFSQWWDMGPKSVMAVEPELRSHSLGIVGHPDLVLDEGLWDIKTPQQPAWKWRLQMSAYLHLALDTYGAYGWNPQEVGCLMLQPDGTMPKLVSYTKKELMDGLARFMEARNLFIALKGGQ